MTLKKLVSVSVLVFSGSIGLASGADFVGCSIYKTDFNHSPLKDDQGKDVNIYYKKSSSRHVYAFSNDKETLSVIEAVGGKGIRSVSLDIFYPNNAKNLLNFTSQQSVSYLNAMAPAPLIAVRSETVEIVCAEGPAERFKSGTLIP